MRRKREIDVVEIQPGKFAVRVKTWEKSGIFGWFWYIDHSDCGFLNSDIDNPYIWNKTEHIMRYCLFNDSEAALKHAHEFKLFDNGIEGLMIQP